eukprot:7383425-Prymnesium_polylepis.1
MAARAAATYAEHGGGCDRVLRQRVSGRGGGRGVAGACRAQDAYRSQVRSPAAPRILLPLPTSTTFSISR